MPLEQERVYESRTTRERVCHGREREFVTNTEPRDREREFVTNTGQRERVY